MADTARSKAALQQLFADNSNGDISAQDLRDFVESIYGAKVVSVKDFGATGNGTTDDYNAVTSALKSTNTKGDIGAVYFPAGNYLLTSALTYDFQSLFGDGKDISVITGAAGRDVFWAARAYASAGAIRRPASIISNLTFRVNDSIETTTTAAANPSAAPISAFNRGGAGNAGLAFEWQDPSIQNKPYMLYGAIKDCHFRAINQPLGGQNGATGVYMQNDYYGCTMSDLFFWRLENGWWEDAPRINASGGTIEKSENYLQNFQFQGCQNQFRMVAPTWTMVENVLIESTQSANEQQFLAVSSRSLVSASDGVVKPGNATLNNFHLTGTGTGTVKIEGGSWTITNFFCQSSAVTFGINDSIIINGDYREPAVLDGTHNRIINPRVNNHDTFSATRAFGNRGESNPNWVGSVSSMHTPTAIVGTRQKRMLHARDGEFISYGRPEESFHSQDDLIVAPGDIRLISGTRRDVQDAPDQHFGHVTVFPSAGLFRWYRTGNVDNTFGEFVPRTKGRMYLSLGNVGASAAQGLTLRNAVSGGDPTNQSSIQTYTATIASCATINSEPSGVNVFDYDFTAETSGLLRVDTGATSANASSPFMAWCAFRPYNQDFFSNTMQLVEKQAEPTAVSGIGQFFVNNDDILQFKFGNGTVVTIASGSSIS